MEMPEFPKDFMENCCPKVSEARKWRKRYNEGGSDDDDLYYAECAFVTAGCGLKCENCPLYIHYDTSGAYNKQDFYYPQIKEFYKKMDE